jgi:ABC-type polar amino acid transport system ATPase subunit
VRIINKIIFNDQTELEIESGNIVIFVGPNNAGKSQTLQDVHALCENNQKDSVVVKSVEVAPINLSDVQDIAEKVCSKRNEGDYDNYRGPGFSFIITRSMTEPISSLEQFTPLLVSMLKTEDRLALVRPPQTINSDETKQHPIHFVASNREYREKLDSFFLRAFGKHIMPNKFYGRDIPLVIGDIPNSESLPHDDPFEITDEFGSLLNRYPQVQNQGDGIRSFVGIVLNLMLDFYQLYLLDEPESFLHPPQARILGEVIGELIPEDKQCLISTHSRDILRGLLETRPDRVIIVRITRDDDTNHFKILENEDVKNFWKDPLLRYSDILDCLFHETTVLCESDSDCRVYSAVLDELASKNGRYSQALFSHVGGKQRMPSIIRMLKKLGVKYRAIADLDVLNDRGTMKSFVKACGGDWSTFEADYNTATAPFCQPTKMPLRKTLNDELNKSADERLKEYEVEKLKELLRGERPWGRVKSDGIGAFPPGKPHEAASRILERLKELGLFLVPVGELESFVKDVGGHGPNWANEVLSRYPNLMDDDHYEEVRKFVSGWGIG